MTITIESIERYEDRAKVHGQTFGKVNRAMTLDVPVSEAKGLKVGQVLKIR